MADITSRQFRWIGADDSVSTHLELRTGELYPNGNISAGLLRKFKEEGKLEFVDDPVDVELPADIMLKVQDGSIALVSLVQAVRDGIKERNNG